MPTKKTSHKSVKQQIPRKPSSAPVAKSYHSETTCPVYKNVGSDGSIRIKRTEFVGSVTNGSTTGFAVTPVAQQTPGYDINPACSILFPWLSVIATRFERFRFNKLRFRLIPSQATSTPGRLYASIDYDFDDAVPVSKTSMMSNRSIAECPVWEQLIVEAAPSQLHPDMPFKYVSTTGRNNFVEPRTAYCGFLILAFDTTSSNLLYDLEVSYDVDLMLPVLDEVGVYDSFNGAATQTVTRIFPDMQYTTGLHLGQIMDFAEIPGSWPIKFVRPGSNGVPPLRINLTGGGGPIARGAVDIGPSGKREGSLNILATCYRDAATPISTLTGTDEKMSYQIFSGLGDYLGMWGAMTPALTGGRNAVATEWSTVGKGLTNSCGMNFAKLFQDLPTARYLVPLLSATMASVLDRVQAGFTFNP